MKGVVAMLVVASALASPPGGEVAAPAARLLDDTRAVSVKECSESASPERSLTLAAANGLEEGLVEASVPASPLAEAIVPQGWETPSLEPGFFLFRRLGRTEGSRKR